jgi:hypothetical protein
VATMDTVTSILLRVKYFIGINLPASRPRGR